mmetsp:Transcript_8748/g.20222  ORF Transcript_8748/g.20222 Transcript_8748/m.20222 type:complete len:92 (-) Transcript_8748:23-298(-)
MLYVYPWRSGYKTKTVGIVEWTLTPIEQQCSMLRRRGSCTNRNGRTINMARMLETGQRPTASNAPTTVPDNSTRKQMMGKCQVFGLDPIQV